MIQSLTMVTVIAFSSLETLGKPTSTFEVHGVYQCHRRRRHILIVRYITSIPTHWENQRNVGGHLIASLSKGADLRNLCMNVIFRRKLIIGHGPRSSGSILEYLSDLSDIYIYKYIYNIIIIIYINNTYLDII